MPGLRTNADDLDDLAATAWRIHTAAEQAALPHLVRPSIPILFFGDSRRYFVSPLRVITVGLNPSKLEFPEPDPFVRFPAAREPPRRAGLDGRLPAYIESLNDYFRVAPYRSWFNPSFEELLRGLGASYYDGAASIALHTDLCSPLATDPTWSGLGPSEQASLIEDGNALWHELVEILEPDVILISVKRAHLAKIRLAVIEDLGPLFFVERERPYVIEGARRELASGKQPLFVYGKAAQKPFSLISGADKRAAGAAIAKVLHA